MRVAVLTQLTKVYFKHGTPPVYPFDWPALQVGLLIGAAEQG